MLGVMLIAVSLSHESRRADALQKQLNPPSEAPSALRSRGTLIIQLGHIDGITSASFSTDGKRIVTGSNDTTAVLWDVAGAKEIRAFRGHLGGVTSVAFSPDGKQILTGSRDKTARLWDAATGAELHIFTEPAPITSVAFSPDGIHSLTGSEYKSVRLWNVATGKEVCQFEGHSEAVSAVAFSPDGKMCVVSSKLGDARVWDIATQKALHTFRGDGPATFSPDGKRVLVGAQFWDVATGKEMHRLQQKATVKSLAFAPDGKRVLAMDSSLRMWAAENGELLCDYAGIIDNASVVAFSPTGKQFLAATNNNFVLLADSELDARIFETSRWTRQVATRCVD